MKKKTAIVSYGRKGSQRCPNKILRPFGETTLLDIVLSKIKYFDEDAYFGGYEKEFKKCCEDHNVSFIQRSKKSVSIDGPLVDVFDFIKTLDCEKVLFVSACLPFLKLETIKAFLAHCHSNYQKPALAVLERKNYFFDNKKMPLFYVEQGEMNTKTVKQLYESANALYFFDKNYFLEKGFFWDWNNVGLVPFKRTYEFLDIDTEDDFKTAELIYLAGGR